MILRSGRRAAIGLVGGATVATGLVLIPLPGPGLVIVAAGLGILSREFEAPRRLFARLRGRAEV